MDVSHPLSDVTLSLPVAKDVPSNLLSDVEVKMYNGECTQPLYEVAQGST